MEQIFALIRKNNTLPLAQVLELRNIFMLVKENTPGKF